METLGWPIKEYSNNEDYEKMIKLSSAVVQIELGYHPEKIGFGTGFFIYNSPPLIITAFHVIPDQKTSLHASFKLNYDNVDNDENLEVIRGGFLLYSNQKLDYSIIKLKNHPKCKFSTIKLEKNDLMWFKPQLFIIHHPLNHYKLINTNHIELIHFNQIKDLIGCTKDPHLIENLYLIEQEDRIAYWECGKGYLTKCTAGGSSGAPIFDINWRIIGIHQEGLRENPSKQTPISVGTHIDLIINDFFEDNLASLFTHL